MPNDKEEAQESYPPPSPPHSINELSTAVSYYRLYPQINNDKPLPSTTQPTENNSNGLWHEDEWTEQDTRDAEHLLREAQERCTIPQHHAYSFHHSPLCKDWDSFYRQHETNFFKDRHYLQQVFPEEMKNPSTLVEVGCGVGNALLPLLQDGWTVWGLDFSQVAIDLLKRQEWFRKGRAHAYVWDISQPLDEHNDSPKPWLGVANVTTLLFCLSALDPKDMGVAARNVAATIQPGGMLLFRDYGRYDEAQLKLGQSRGKRLGENYYRKHDGTRVYYFSLQDLKQLFVQDAGLEMVELEYIRRVYYNRGTGVKRRRVWVHGRFRKPAK